MRRVLSLACAAAFAAVIAALVATVVFPPDHHYDFSLRMNELSCVRQRVNPYDVWHGDVQLKPYYPNTHKGAVPDGCSKQVNAYVPWAYAGMFPISLLPEGVNWCVYCLLMFMALGGIVAFVSRHAVPAMGALVVVAYLLFANMSVGNFSIFVLFGAVLTAWGLQRRSDVLAGVGFALAMVKPQLGLLLAVPLLVRRRFVACAVAAGICLALTFIVSVWLRTPVVDLLLQGPAANTEFFRGCGTWPTFFCGHLSVEVDILIGLLVGLVTCLALTWLVRKGDDWYVLLMPAAICACSWSYANNYCQVMGWFLMFVIVRELMTRPRSKALWVLFALAAFSLSRWVLAWHGACCFMGWRFPLSEYVFRCLDSLNSTLSIAVAAAFCVWKRDPA